jgi:tetratricopeptide (TPR) repeat protein
LYNRLGLLYVRSGLYGEARAEFQRAVAMNSESAMINLGNLAMVDRDYAAAEQWYRMALRTNPGNRLAAQRLEQIAIENFRE